jgi:hypothetical protein
MQARSGNHQVSSLHLEQLLNYGIRLSDYNDLSVTDRNSAWIIVEAAWQ